MKIDPESVVYRITFVAECGVNPPTDPIMEDDIVGREAMLNRLDYHLTNEYESSDWLDPKSGYALFVEENRRTAQRLAAGEISVAAFNVPYGALVVC